ncbi:hypothetical protein TWF103_003583 [Orbilia oligospora]|nr:hypothetical protein TWF103_003583 [Orbilia oligospora]
MPFILLPLAAHNRIASELVLSFEVPKARNNLSIPVILPRDISAAPDAILGHVLHIEAVGSYLNVGRGLNLNRSQCGEGATMQMENILRRIPSRNLKHFEWNITFCEKATRILEAIQLQTCLESLRLRLSNCDLSLCRLMQGASSGRFESLQRIHFEELGGPTDVLATISFFEQAKGISEVRLGFGRNFWMDNLCITMETSNFLRYKYGKYMGLEKIVEILYLEVTKHPVSSLYLSDAKLKTHLDPLLCSRLRSLTLRGCNGRLTIPNDGLFLNHLNIHQRLYSDWEEMMKLLFTRLQPGLLSLALYIEAEAAEIDTFYTLPLAAIMRHHQSLKSIAICLMDGSGRAQSRPIWPDFNSQAKPHCLKEFLVVLPSQGSGANKPIWIVPPSFYRFAATLKVIHIVVPESRNRLKLGGGYSVSPSLHIFLEDIAQASFPASPKLECLILGFRGENTSVFQVLWAENLLQARPKYIPSFRLTSIRDMRRHGDLDFYCYNAGFASDEKFDILPSFDRSIR